MQHFRKVSTLQEDFEALGLLPGSKSKPMTEAAAPAVVPAPTSKVKSKTESKSAPKISLSEAQDRVNRALASKGKASSKEKSAQWKAAQKFLVQGVGQIASLAESLKSVKSAKNTESLSESFKKIAKMAESLRLRFDEYTLAVEADEKVGGYVGDDKPFEKLPEPEKADDVEHMGDKDVYKDAEKETKDAPDVDDKDNVYVGDDLKQMKEDALDMLDKLRTNVLSVDAAGDILNDMVKFLGGAAQRYMDLAADAKANKYAGTDSELDSDSDKDKPVDAASNDGWHVGDKVYRADQTPNGQPGKEEPVVQGKDEKAESRKPGKKKLSEGEDDEEGVYTSKVVPHGKTLGWATKELLKDMDVWLDNAYAPGTSNKGLKEFQAAVECVRQAHMTLQELPDHAWNENAVESKKTAGALTEGFTETDDVLDVVANGQAIKRKGGKEYGWMLDEVFIVNRDGAWYVNAAGSAPGSDGEEEPVDGSLSDVLTKLWRVDGAKAANADDYGESKSRPVKKKV